MLRTRLTRRGDRRKGHSRKAAQLQYAGPAPGEIAGVMQINVPLPLGLQPGSAVPVAIFVGSPLSSSQSNVTIAVR
jgi:uncharacterized protein (TIGR03437 family)